MFPAALWQDDAVDKPAGLSWLRRRQYQGDRTEQEAQPATADIV